MPDHYCAGIWLIGLVISSVIRVCYGIIIRNNVVETNREPVTDKFLMSLAGMGFLLPIINFTTSWLDFGDYHAPVWTGIAGTVIYAAAQWLLWRSHVDLGQNWSKTLQIRDSHSLITSGVYHAVRHPMYAAHFLWGIGQSLLLPNLIAGFSMLLSMAPLYFYRMKREEKMMLEKFGSEYSEYMTRTGRIFPKF